jgi:hypothetical protein
LDCHGYIFYAILGACKKEDLTEISTEKEANSTSEMTKIGKKLENPFTIQNMSKALENLYSNARLTENISVETSHLYVKFKPKTELELDILKKDSTLDLYSYPLDYEILQAGSYYHDPSLPLNQPTYQYSCVLADYTFPKGVEYEILAECYIPDDLPITPAVNARKLSDESIDALITEAFKITNNKLSNTPITNARISASKWTPSGKIQVWDNSITTSGKFVPIEGIEVKARNWLTTREGFTNSNGDFKCNGTLRGSAKYHFKWDRHQFSIRSGTTGQAEYNGPEISSNWNLNIQGTSQESLGHIFKATYKYYYGDILGLSRPPTNDNIFDPQIKIATYTEKDPDCSSCLGVHNRYKRFFGLGNQIKIFDILNQKSEVLFGTTIHELTHASHWYMDRSSYDNSSSEVIESWASGVEWAITRLVYTNYNIDYFTKVDSYYTRIVVDMIDGISGYDKVSGYTILEL